MRKQILRVILLIPLLYTYWLAAGVLKSVMGLIAFLSFWAVHFSFIWICVSMKCTYDQNINSKLGWLALHHFLLEVAMIMNLFVFIVYWILVHDDVHSRFADDPAVMYFMSVVHIYPIFCGLGNFYITDVRMIYSHWKGQAIFGITYCTINCLESWRRGKSLYWFLDWKDYKSPLYCSIAITCYVMIFFFLAYLSHIINPEIESSTNDDDVKT
mmetsp:Transcript_17691/g.12732  ORF Transcript_17691/g.12732 Transcript_17691/m.12732 type:complete len:213 (-) Transcript_17691:45-683(-)